MLPLVVLAGNILESYSPPPWLVQRMSENQAKVLMARNWKSIWDAIRSTPGAFPPHFGGRMRRAEGDCIGKGQTKGNQGRIVVKGSKQKDKISVILFGISLGTQFSGTCKETM